MDLVAVGNQQRVTARGLVGETVVSGGNTDFRKGLGPEDAGAGFGNQALLADEHAGTVGGEILVAHEAAGIEVLLTREIGGVGLQGEDDLVVVILELDPAHVIGFHGGSRLGIPGGEIAVMLQVGADFDGVAGHIRAQDKRAAVTEAAELSHALRKQQVVIGLKGGLGDLHRRRKRSVRNGDVGRTRLDIQARGDFEDDRALGHAPGGGILHPVDGVGNDDLIVHIGTDLHFHGPAFRRHLIFGRGDDQGIELRLENRVSSRLGTGREGHGSRTAVIGVVLEDGSLDGRVPRLTTGGRKGHPGFGSLGGPGYRGIDRDG